MTAPTTRFDDLPRTEPPVAVVTGASGEIGRALMARFVDDGYLVVGLDRTQDLLARAAMQFEHTFVPVVCDQTDLGSVSRAFADIVASVGAPCALVANAGYAKFGAMLDMPAATFQRHVAVNLVGTFAVCQAAAQAMVASGTVGALTIVASNLALFHSDRVGAYCVSKAALLPMVQSFAAELGPHGVRVNAVLPGVIDTAMTAPMLKDEYVRESLLRGTPLARLGTVHELAAVVAFLSSADSAWVTGASLTTDGGQSIYAQPQWFPQSGPTTGSPADIRSDAARPTDTKQEFSNG